MSYRTRWSILMTIGGQGLVGLFASGMVFNAIFNPAGRIPH
jgi:hypothetical protein